MVQANTPGQRDGWIAAWIDGVLVADFPNLRLRDIDALTIDRFGIGFHAAGNAGPECRKWYDNVVAARSYIGPMATEAGGGDSGAPGGSEGGGSDGAGADTGVDPTIAPTDDSGAGSSNGQGGGDTHGDGSGNDDGAAAPGGRESDGCGCSSTSARADAWVFAFALACARRRRTR